MGVVTASRPFEKSASVSPTMVNSMTRFMERFSTFTLFIMDTLSVPIWDSSMTLALATWFLRFAIFTSRRPWASRAASYSAFSERSPFSLASAMAAEMTGRCASASARSFLSFSSPSAVM